MWLAETNQQRVELALPIRKRIGQWSHPVLARDLANRGKTVVPLRVIGYLH
ncbi:MAG: hypothetical protein AAGF01_12940 [Cyanobacteria bacterium P01_G01_bin.38]